MNRKNGLRFLPGTGVAWSLSISGLLLSGFALWIELPMWLVESGVRSVSDWAGEYAFAFYIGLPCTILSVILLGIGLSRQEWRSQLTWFAFASSVILLFASVLVIVANESR